jgi:hypothetical protein
MTPLKHLASVERGRRWRMRDEGELYLGCIHIIYCGSAGVYTKTIKLLKRF